ITMHDPMPNSNGHSDSTHQMASITCDSDNQCIHAINFNSESQMNIPVLIQNVPAQFLWDAGADCSIIHMPTYIELGRPMLRPSDKRLKTYDQKPLHVLGSTMLRASVENKVAEVEFFVISEDFGNIFGRNMMKEFCTDWKKDLIEKYFPSIS